MNERSTSIPAAKPGTIGSVKVDGSDLYYFVDPGGDLHFIDQSKLPNPEEAALIGLLTEFSPRLDRRAWVYRIVALVAVVAISVVVGFLVVGRSLSQTLQGWPGMVILGGIVGVIAVSISATYFWQAVTRSRTRLTTNLLTLLKQQPDRVEVSPSVSVDSQVAPTPASKANSQSRA